MFLVKNIRYRYGFEADKKIIHSEWLFECKEDKEKPLFIRDKNSIEITDDFAEGNGVEEKTRDNALFLSVVDQFNGSISKTLIKWFNWQTVISGIQHEKEKGLTSLFFESSNLKTWIKDFLTPLSLGFQDFKLIEIDKTNKRVVTSHNKYNETGDIVDKLEFDLLSQESSGTNKLYDMAGRLTHSLNTGRLIIIDELDAKLHPLLTMAVVSFTIHPKKIFVTHN